MSGSDYAPTVSQREVAQLLHERAATARTEYNDVTARELAAINEQLRRSGLDVIGG